MSEWSKIVLHLLKKNCYKTGNFTLASGKTSTEYINVKPAILSAGMRETLASALFARMVDRTQEDNLLPWASGPIMGIPEGGVPLASALTTAAWNETGKESPLILGRHALKDHGTGSTKEAIGHFEGLTLPCANVLLIEDVVTTGGSVMKWVDLLRLAGVQNVSVLAVVNRQQGADTLFMDRGVVFNWLVTLDEIRNFPFPG